MQYLPVNTFRRIHAFGRIGLRIARLHLRLVLLKVGDIARQRVGPVVDQILGKLSLLSIDFRVRGNMGWIHDRCIKPCLDRVIQKNAVEYGACVRLQTEGDIADAENSEDSWKFSFDTLDGF